MRLNNSCNSYAGTNSLAARDFLAFVTNKFDWLITLVKTIYLSCEKTWHCPYTQSLPIYNSVCIQKQTVTVHWLGPWVAWVKGKMAIHQLINLFF